MPRSYQEIVDQAEELSRAFEENVEPAVAKEEAALRAGALRRALAEASSGTPLPLPGKPAFPGIASAKR
jgi:hypothetical protein